MLAYLEFLHVGIDNPFQVLFSFIRASWPRIDSPEQFRPPLNALLCPYCRFFSLPILDLGFFFRGIHVICNVDCLDGAFPEPPTLPLALFADRPCQWRAVFCICGIEEQGLFARTRISDEHLARPKTGKLV